MLLRADVLRGSLSASRLLDALHVALGRAIVRVPLAAGAGAAETARAAACRRVLSAAPVERVVHRLESRLRVVADLVPRVAALAQLGAERVAHLLDGIVLGKLDLAALDGARHRHFFR